jgi:hypothetical protein
MMSLIWILLTAATRVGAPETLQASYNEGTQTLRIIGVDPKLPDNERRGLSADITLSLPKEVMVQVVNDVGDVRVEDMDSLSVETKVGDIEASYLTGKVDLRSDVGDISLDNSPQDTQVRTRVGDISIKLDEALNAPLVAENDVGDIQLSLPDDSNVTITATSSSRSLEGDLERITANEGRLRLGSGDYAVTLSTNVGEVQVESKGD